jgi:hypothetical protein
MPVPIGEILGYVLVTVGIGVIARAGYLMLGGQPHGVRLPVQDRALAETEERMNSDERHSAAKATRRDYRWSRGHGLR